MLEIEDREPSGDLCEFGCLRDAKIDVRYVDGEHKTRWFTCCKRHNLELGLRAMSKEQFPEPKVQEKQ